MPKVSVIVPVHNPGKYLIPLVNSIIYQTFKDIEIFLIDDGSTDGSREILKQFEAQDKRITTIFREPSPHEKFGQKYSADLGRSLATGNYIMMVDHDDQLALDAIETLYSHTLEETIDVVQGRYKQIDEQDNIILKTPNIWKNPTIISNLETLPEDILLLHLAYAPIALWACLIRNELLKDLELTDCIFNDTDFIWKLKIKAKTFCYIPNEVYIYRMHNNSTSTCSNADKVISNIFTILDCLKDFLDEEKISEKLWNIYYVFKFYTLYKMHAGLSPMIKLNYLKEVSKYIQSDIDITHLLMISNIDKDILLYYLLLRGSVVSTGIGCIKDTGMQAP